MAAHEATYLNVLQAGKETTKVEFKRMIQPEGDGLAEVIKDFCAIANAEPQDDEDDRTGLLFLGVEDDGTVSGLPADFDHDAFERRLTQRLEHRVAPPLRFTVTPPITDPLTQCTFAVVRLHAPTLHPHIVMRECGPVRAGGWYTRRGALTVLAGPEELATLQRRVIAREVQPLRYTLDRLSAELDLLRQQAVQHAAPGPLAPTVNSGELSDVALAEVIRQQFAPKEESIITRLRQQGRDLADQIIHLHDTHFGMPSGVTGDQLKVGIAALEAAARPMAETIFEVSAFVDDERVIRTVAEILEDVVERTVVDRIAIDGELAALLWYPITLCAYAACEAAVIHGRYTHLIPMFTGAYDQERFTLLRVVRVLSRAEQWYTRVTGSRECAPLARRAVQTTIGAGGWFTARAGRNSEWVGHFAEIILSLVWMQINSTFEGLSAEQRAKALPLPSGVFYRRQAARHIEGLLKRQAPALQAAWPDLKDWLRVFDANAKRYSGEDGCFFEYHPHLTEVLDEPLT